MSKSTQHTMDPFLPAFLELAQVGLLGQVPNDTTRQVVATGKSARLLRAGDVIARRDLTLTREPVPGVIEVSSARIDGPWLDVMTIEQATYRIPASRLVLTHHPLG